MSNLWREGLSINKPRWVILLLDMMIVIVAFLASYVLIFKHRGGVEMDAMQIQLFIVSTIYLICFFILGTFKGVVHKTGIRELQRIVLAIMLAYFLSVVFCRL
jgi:hypothetical protein